MLFDVTSHQIPFMFLVYYLFSGCLFYARCSAFLSQTLIHRMKRIRMSLVQEGEVKIKLRTIDLEMSKVTMTVGLFPGNWIPSPEWWDTDAKAFIKVGKK